MTKSLAIILELLKQFEDASIVALTDMLTDIYTNKYGQVKSTTTFSKMGDKTLLRTTYKYLQDVQKKTTDQEILDVIDQLIYIVNKRVKSPQPVKG